MLLFILRYKQVCRLHRQGLQQLVRNKAWLWKQLRIPMVLSRHVMTAGFGVADELAHERELVNATVILSHWKLRCQQTIGYWCQHLLR
jgi:hypothetical protein